jgi:hypothetical protein
MKKTKDKHRTARANSRDLELLFSRGWSFQMIVDWAVKSLIKSKKQGEQR